jgi:hypothetical protein
MNKQRHKASEAQTPPSTPSTLPSYKDFIAELILRYITKGGAIKPAHAFHEVVGVTQRSYGTVKNWVIYRNSYPDLESLARIVHHWQIPPEEVFLPGIATHTTVPPTVSSGDQLLLPLYGQSNPKIFEAALSLYTDHPQSLMLVRQQGVDMEDEVRAGEIMVVDASQEQIRNSGMYVLRYSAIDGSQSTCTRMVEVLVGQQAASIRCSNARFFNTVETLPLANGLLPSHIVVLGRVQGVLKPT